MVDEGGRSYNKCHIESSWLLSPEVRPICVTGVVAMYARKSHLSFLLPQPSNLPPFPISSTSLPSSLCAFNVAIKAFKDSASSFLHSVAPLQFAEVVPH